MRPPHPSDPGFIPDPVDCTCDEPRPDAIGQCAWCRRLVITVAAPEGLAAEIAARHADEIVEGFEADLKAAAAYTDWRDGNLR